VAHELPGHGWTLKKLCQWVKSRLGRQVSRTTLRRILKAARLSWKKCKKLLKKANPEKRSAFIEQLQGLSERMCRDEVCIVYVDESHFHQDLDLGHTWAPVGQAVWRESISPPLSARINWYGAYDFSQGQALIWQEGKCNSEHTVQFLQGLAAWPHLANRQLVIIWDGAPWHRSQVVRTQAQQLGIELIQLPGYSPDLNRSHSGRKAPLKGCGNGCAKRSLSTSATPRYTTSSWIARRLLSGSILTPLP
jgi:transposase